MDNYELLDDDDMETFAFAYEIAETTEECSSSVTKTLPDEHAGTSSGISALISQNSSKKALKKQKKAKRKKKKRKKCHNTYHDDCLDLIDFSGCSLSGQPPDQNNTSIPKQVFLHSHDPGFAFGIQDTTSAVRYIGMPQGEEGNISVVGGNGSGKSSGIAKPTLKTWQGAMCVTDIKGELSDFYKVLYNQDLVTRPYIIFDPTNPDDDAISYDPFYWLQKDGDDNLVSNIWELVLAIIPVSQDDKQPFWAETEQAILAASLLYFFQCGLSFSAAVALIANSTVTELSRMILDDGDNTAKMLLGEIVNMKDETRATFDRGLRNKIMLFATDPHISHAFRGKREDAPCFTWDDLDNSNIFLRLPAERIEQWSSAINLMYTQLIRHLERKPDKYSLEGMNNIQTLLLMDEFARFGKLEMITNAMSTLRSKNVNVCIMVQSIAQLDKIYGEYDRRIILDNCQFQAILKANDSETQKYLSELIGTKTGTCRSISENMNEFMEEVSYSRQLSETREYKIYPHELSTLEDILLLTPYGFCRADKIQLHNNSVSKRTLLVEPERIFHATCVVTSKQKETSQANEDLPPDEKKIICADVPAKDSQNADCEKINPKGNEQNIAASTCIPDAKQISVALKEVILKCRPLTKGYRKHRKN